MATYKIYPDGTTGDKVIRAEGVPSSSVPVSHGSFLTVRDTGSGYSVNTSFTGNAGLDSGAGSSGLAWGFGRYFATLDTSGVTEKPTSATFYIQALAQAGAQRRIIAVEANHPTTITTASFQNIVNWNISGSLSGRAIDYSSAKVINAGDSGFHSYPLNDTALDHMVSQSELKLALIDYDYDYSYVEPPVADIITTLYLASAPGVAVDPYLEYEVPSATSVQKLTRNVLYNGKLITVQLDANTDYEFKTVNNLDSVVYFNLEGVGDKDIFNTSSFRVTTSTSGSNILGFVSESQRVGFVLKAKSTGSFILSGSSNLIGNNIKAVATNLHVYNPEDPTSSGSMFGVDLDILELT